MSGINELMHEVLTGLVRERGNQPVHINTEYCQTHQASRGNCTECESQPGCRMLVLLKLEMVKMGTLPPPRTMDEFDQRSKEFNQRIDKILEEGGSS